MLIVSSTNFAQNVDTVGQKVTFYPASMVLSHNARPLVFYRDTKLVNLVFQMAPLPMSSFSPLSNHSCSYLKAIFFNQILTSVREIQKVINHLLSLPGFSNLIECTSYLPRFYTYKTGLPAQMSCPHGYRSLLKECKVWAIKYCTGFTNNERV